MQVKRERAADQFVLSLAVDGGGKREGGRQFRGVEAHATQMLSGEHQSRVWSVSEGTGDLQVGILLQQLLQLVLQAQNLLHQEALLQVAGRLSAA